MVQISKTTKIEYLQEAKVRGEEQLFVTTSNGELIGYCKYRLSDDCVILLDLVEKQGDIVLADAMVRAVAGDCRDFYQYVECGTQGLLPLYRKRSGLYAGQNREKIENVLRGGCAL